MITRIKENKYLNCIISFFVVLMIMIVALYIFDFAPFGNNSLAWNDADIQYLDFFSYYKNVFEGTDSFLYTFSKTLGGNNIAVLSYYLSSPLNLLILLFDKCSMHSIFDILVILKLGIAAFTCSFFLMKRFSKDRTKSFHDLIIISLSVCYALSQYSLAQCSNVMWLDGVYMLPLILLGIYELVNNKRIGKLSACVAISIIFNWYTGGINCLFSIIWFLFELSLKLIQKDKIELKEILVIFFKYICAMLLGVMLSAFLFLPTVGALTNSTRGSLDFNSLFNLDIIANAISIIQGYCLGATSNYGFVSLYCGSLPLLGFLGCFFTKKLEFDKKIILFLMSIITILLFYFAPFISLFSLLKDVSSYWYRYSYCGIIVMIFFSCYYFLKIKVDEKDISLIKIASIFSFLILSFNYINNNQDNKHVNFTVLFLILTAIGIELIINYKNIKIKKIISSLLSMMLILEITYSVKLQMFNYHVETVSNYQEYVLNQEKQINHLKDYDTEKYRISQTSTRNMYENNTTSRYNDALAYNYMSISGYTSSPDDIQRELLDRLGYRINGENMCIVNTSILPADSLLGVKYVLSPYEINGLKEITQLGKYNNKKTYNNPYCLPMAFKYNDNDFDVSNQNNPFLYMNQLYSKLVGENVELFKPLSYKKDDINNLYTVNLLKGNYSVYGNLPYQYEVDSMIDVNDKYTIKYTGWLSQSVFYIPTSKYDINATIKIDTNLYDALKDNQEQFYALDLDKFLEVTKLLSKNEAEIINLENGKVNIEVNGNKEENLYISVPHDDGWIVTVNKKEIEPELFAECMYSIPLEDGNNKIEMKYKVKYLVPGICISIFAMIIYIILFYLDKKKIKHICNIVKVVRK